MKLPSGSTMCRDGSSFASLAMALSGHGISVTPASVLPMARSGFKSLSLWDENILYMGIQDPKPHYLDMIDGLKRGAVFLATIVDEKRTVLVTGYDDQLNKMFSVLDPTSDQREMSYDELHQLHVFWIGPKEIAQARRLRM